MPIVVFKAFKYVLLHLKAKVAQVIEVEEDFLLEDKVAMRLLLVINFFQFQLLKMIFKMITHCCDNVINNHNQHKTV